MFFLNIIIHELSSIVDEFVSRFLQFFFYANSLTVNPDLPNHAEECSIRYA